MISQYIQLLLNIINEYTEEKYLHVARRLRVLECRHGRGLGPPMGWVGLGWVEF